MNDVLDELLDRGLGEQASGIQRGPSAVIVVARARRQTRQRRLLGAGLAVVLAAGVAGLVPLLTRGPSSGPPALSGSEVIGNLGDGRTLLWRQGDDGTPELCVLQVGDATCLQGSMAEIDRPLITVTDDVVLGMAGRRFTRVSVTVGEAAPRDARTFATRGLTVFVLVGPTTVAGEPSQRAALSVVATTDSGETSRVGTEAVETPPDAYTSLVGLKKSDPAQQRGGLYGWTKDGWGCLTWGEPKADPPTLEDLRWPAWCQRLPEGRTAVSLGWTDDPADTTQIPWAINLLVPAQTTRVTIGGHVLKLRTVDDQTWAYDPTNPFVADVQHAQVVVTGEHGDVLWQGTYLQTALRGPMP